MLAGARIDMSQSTNTDTQGVVSWGLAEDPQLLFLQHIFCVFS